MFIEVAGGIYAGSLAIITDAAHLLSDVSGFGVSMFAAYYAAKKSSEHHSFGYHRVEVLGALASMISVWLVTGILVWEAGARIIKPEPVDGKSEFGHIQSSLIHPICTKNANEFRARDCLHCPFREATLPMQQCVSKKQGFGFIFLQLCLSSLLLASW